MAIRYLGILFCFALTGSIWSQEEGGQSLPRTYREFALGMSLENLKEALKKDDLFHFRGDRDVSFLPAKEQNLVETTGLSFIKRAFFQLQSDHMFVMAFTLNTALIDYYSVFTAFVKKYGEPKILDPKQAVWETGETRVAIERPLTIKYLDMTVFNELNNTSQAAESQELRMREDFLHEF
ncbi:MAG: hypothetical protein LBG90_00075 [Spirochaetaceae bacterium]|jgi:hypothetical protein|nr:hypothetical protein [Spirochaetaceae bacterium]